MYTDAEFVFSEEQDIGQVAGAYVSTNVVDLWGSATSIIQDLGSGHRLAVHFGIVEAVAGATATVQFDVVRSAAAALTTPSLLASTGALLGTGVLTAGAQFALVLPPDIMETYTSNLRYLGVIYTVAVATTTAGTVNAHLVTDPQDGMRFYPPGYVWP
jgi:hypothetical protein